MKNDKRKDQIIIGITANQKKVGVNFSTKQQVSYIAQAFLDLFKDYDSVVTIILPSDLDPSQAETVCGMLDGLILSSGEDLHPSTYHAPELIHYDDRVNGLGSPYHRPKLLEPNLRRDLFELELYRVAKQKNIPILGICRGMQLINVAEEGKLYQEIPTSSILHFVEEDGWIHYHEVEIEQESLVGSILELDRYPISSIHHQGIEVLGKNLKISARANDGLIEIIEHKEKEFIVGVQGHIEKITTNFPFYKKLIDAFVKSAETWKNSLIFENK